MADKLIVRDFGPIKDAELDIKKTTVLIGPQGSGKSTLAKLVAIFNSIITGDEDFEALMSNYGLSSSYLNHNTFLKNIPQMSSFTNSTTYQNCKLEFEFGQKTTSIKLNGFETFKHFYIPAERTFLPLITQSIFGLLTHQVSIPNFILEFGRVYEVARKRLIHYLLNI